MLAESREKFKKIEIFFGKIFSKFGLSPNQFTLISIAFGIFCFVFLILKKIPLALIFFLISAFLDFVDGAVARHLNKVTKKGAYLDTISDRLVEGLIFLGILSLPLPKFIIEAKYWIFLCFFGSLMTTYAKAAAKEKELIWQELKKGFFGRGERIILLATTIFIGIFNLNLMIYPLSLLAIFSNLTAFQRIILALRS
jgi:phosphatidylglycerophosphate synthase